MECNKMDDLINHYAQNADQYYADAFSRNIGLLTEGEQKKLRNFKIAIAGVGGVGGFHLMTLLRLGVGKFHIADMDCYEIPNLQRQCGAFMETLGKNKAASMKQTALSVNPHADIQTFEKGVLENNIDQFLSGVDILIDGIEFFSIEIRRLIFKEAQKRGIYTITAGPLGFGSALLIFAPSGMRFDEYFDIKEGMNELEKLVAFGVGLAPASLHMRYIDLNSFDLNTKSGPSLVLACQLCASLAATETLKILLNRKPVKSAPHYCQFDPYEQECRKGYLWRGNKHPFQRLKRWYLLKKFSSMVLIDKKGT